MAWYESQVEFGIPHVTPHEHKKETSLNCTLENVHAIWYFKTQEIINMGFMSE